MKILVSPFKNPFLNLALEDYFLRSDPQLPLLFCYVNRPSVILGRFQNPWLETNLSYLTENDIWLVRRQSGGGCVYHDDGNLNFSMIVNGPMVDRKKLNEVIVSAFKRIDVELTISPRNDLWLQDGQLQTRKISGSAYKQTKLGSFHHCTFLVNSDLDRLEKSLKYTLIAKNTKSIPSVRSRVISLNEMLPGVEIHDVIELVSDSLKTSVVNIDGTILSEPSLQESFYHLRSWEWLWGETPLFEIHSGIEIRKGIIQKSGEKFNRSSMSQYLSEIELEKLFPDFSEQHNLSNQIL